MELIWEMAKHQKKKKSMLFFSLTWKVDTCSSDGLFCPMKVQCLCEMLICASFGLTKSKTKKKKTPTRLVWQAAADVSTTSELGERTMFEEAVRWIGMDRRGLEPPVNFPSTQIWDFLQHRRGKNKISSQDKRKDIPRKFERIWTEAEQVLNISTCGANRLPRMGNAAAVSSRRSVIFLIGFAGVCDASICLNLTFAKIYMALNKTEI